MNKEMLQAKWQYFNMVQDVTVRAIQVFSDRDLDFRPTPQVRSVRELIFHLCAQEKVLTEGVRDGFTKELEESLVRRPRQGKKGWRLSPPWKR